MRSSAPTSKGAEAAARGLEQRIRLEARSMAEKYLEPPHTTDFAILFLPTEGLYAEVLRRPGLMEALQRDHRVTLAGPTTLMAMLNSLQMGFRTLALEKRSSEVWQVLGAVKTEFGKFGDVLAKVKSQTQTVLNTLDSAETRSRAMSRALKTVEALPQDQASQVLPLDGTGRAGRGLNPALRWRLSRLVAAQICLHACMTGFRMAAPLMALREGYSPAAVGMLLALFALAQVFLSLPAGRYADRHGLKRPLKISVGVATAGALLAVAFPVFGVLCVTALACGASTGLALIALQRHVGQLANGPMELKQVFSWMAIGPSISNFIGPFLAGLLIDASGFRAAYLLLAVSALAGLVVGAPGPGAGAGGARARCAAGPVLASVARGRVSPADADQLDAVFVLGCAHLSGAGDRQRARPERHGDRLDSGRLCAGGHRDPAGHALAGAAFA